MNETLFRGLVRQRGVTLIELMVALTIGLLISLFVSSLYLGSKSSYRVNDDISRMQEEGRVVMNLIGRNLMQAGAGSPLSPSVNPDTTFTLAKVPGLRGCNKGFSAPSTGNFDCASSGSTPAFEVAYATDDTVNIQTGAGTDCNGQTVPTNPNDDRIAINRFYLSTADTTKNLYCVGNGSSTPQPLINNVIDMRLTYAVNANDDIDTNGFRSIDRLYTSLPATSEFNLESSTAGSNQWRQVIGVEVCLELNMPNAAVQSGSGQSYLACDGTIKTSPAGELRTVIKGMYTLRNNASPRNTPRS